MYQKEQNDIKITKTGYKLMTLTVKSQGFNAQNLNNSDFYYHVITTIKSLVQQSRHELTLKAITEGWFLRRKRSFSRSYLAKATGLHKDTISTHNMFWEKEGIIQVERYYHEINSYGHKFIGILGEIFGYVPIGSTAMEYRSASLLTNLNLNNKYSLITIEDNTSEKREIGEKSPDRETIKGNLKKLPPKDLTVFCPYESGMGFNTYLLFEEKFDFPITCGFDASVALPRGKSAASFLQALRDKINSFKQSKQ